MSSSRPSRLFLVRHAETEWNAAQLFQGHLDSKLTPRGVKQASQLAEHLAAEGITDLYSSDQGRALDTAGVIATRLGLRTIPRSDLREIDCGEWTGKSYQDVRKTWPEDHAGWRYRPHLHRMPQGESVAEVQIRALSFVEEILALHIGRSVCAVTHTTVARAVVCELMGLPLEKFWVSPRQPNCAVNLIELRDGRPVLVQSGDVSYMDGDQPTAISRMESVDGVI